MLIDFKKNESYIRFISSGLYRVQPWVERPEADFERPLSEGRKQYARIGPRSRTVVQAKANYIYIYNK